MRPLRNARIAADRGENYLCVTEDLYGIADSAFLAVYSERLRRVLAEAVRGVGGLPALLHDQRGDCRR